MANTSREPRRRSTSRRSTTRAGDRKKVGEKAAPNSVYWSLQFGELVELLPRDLQRKPILLIQQHGDLVRLVVGQFRWLLNNSRKFANAGLSALSILSVRTSICHIVYDPSI